MSQMPWYCPGCAGEQPFEQFHDGAGSCPDSPDGHCPEWVCCECGTALIVGFVPQAEPFRGSARRSPGRAA
jgi:hypothetical protein